MSSRPESDRGAFLGDLDLVAPELSDADAVLAAVRESYAELHRWMPWCGPDYALGDVLAWLEAQATARSTGAAHEFLIEDAAGDLLGTCGINRVDRAYRFANVGYWVRSSQTGRGIATRAVRRVIEWAYANTDLNRLEIVAAVGNTASRRVAEKAGAVREGVLRARLLIHGSFHDAVMYSVVRDPHSDP